MLQSTYFWSPGNSVRPPRYSIPLPELSLCLPRALSFNVLSSHGYSCRLGDLPLSEISSIPLSESDFLPGSRFLPFCAEVTEEPRCTGVVASDDRRCNLELLVGRTTLESAHFTRPQGLGEFCVRALCVLCACVHASTGSGY